MQLIFQAADAQDLKKQVLDFISLMPTLPLQGQSPVAEANQLALELDKAVESAPEIKTAVEKATQMVAEEKRGRGRPRNPNKPVIEAKEIVKEEPTITPPTADEQRVARYPSDQEAKAALQMVHSSKGLPKAREILATFGAQRFSELRPTDYHNFITRCQDSLA